MNFLDESNWLQQINHWSKNKFKKEKINVIRIYIKENFKFQRIWNETNIKI